MFILLLFIRGEITFYIFQTIACMYIYKKKGLFSVTMNLYYLPFSVSEIRTRFICFLLFIFQHSSLSLVQIIYYLCIFDYGFTKPSFFFFTLRQNMERKKKLSAKSAYNTHTRSSPLVKSYTFISSTKKCCQLLSYLLAFVYFSSN